MSNGLPSFWPWLVKGTGAEPGYTRVIDRWLVCHLAVGAGLGLIVPVSVKAAATTLLLPLAAILVGLSFAWGGNAQALLQTEEIEEFAQYREGGFPEYVFTFQLAILTILITLSLWGVAGLGVFDCVWPTSSNEYGYFGVEVLLYAFAALTVRACWHVVLGAQKLLIVRRKVRAAKDAAGDANGSAAQGGEGST